MEEGRRSASILALPRGLETGKDSAQGPADQGFGSKREGTVVFVQKSLRARFCAHLALFFNDRLQPMHPHLQMNQNMESANAHAKSALPWNLGVLWEIPRFQDSKIFKPNLGILWEIPRFQDSRIFKPNLGILEFSGKFRDSKIFRVNLGILEFSGRFRDSKIFRVNLGILEFSG